MLQNTLIKRCAGHNKSLLCAKLLEDSSRNFGSRVRFSCYQCWWLNDLYADGCGWDGLRWQYGAVDDEEEVVHLKMLQKRIRGYSSECFAVTDCSSSACKTRNEKRENESQTVFSEKSRRSSWNDNQLEKKRGMQEMQEHGIQILHRNCR